MSVTEYQTAADLDIADYLKPGDTVVIGQAAAEPPVLVEKLIRAAQTIEGLTVVCGYTLSDAWEGATPGKPRIKTYVAHGALRALSAKGMLDIVPFHYSRLEELIATRRLPADVVLLQVAPPDSEGFYCPGTTVDYAVAATRFARTVLVEVNTNMPHTRSTRSIPQASVAAAILSSRQLAGSPTRPPTEAEHKVAENIAPFIPSGATIQLGASALADAVARELRDRRWLRVRSGLAGDWLADLDEAGALDEDPGSCVIGMALGTERLYKYLATSGKVLMAPIHELTAQPEMARCDPYVAVNAAIEVDMLGQVNAELAGGRYVGAVGGQVDFFRAARRASSGLAIVALAATNAAGTVSRIVPALSGPVTTPQSDVDLVVTEFGAADLRGASYAQRAERLIGIAAPRHRDELRANLPQWLGSLEPKPDNV